MTNCHNSVAWTKDVYMIKKYLKVFERSNDQHLEASTTRKSVTLENVAGQ